ncbi:MAG: hypothetical protein LBU87_01970 [Lactobacillales bacterium]|jgi:hypothetical protein|nr:hypothetical protein [Lactobacillales bacterium]
MNTLIKQVNKIFNNAIEKGYIEQIKRPSIAEMNKALKDALIDFIQKQEIDWRDIKHTTDRWTGVTNYDEDKYYELQKTKAYDSITADGWGEYLPIKGTKWWDEYISNSRTYRRVQSHIRLLFENSL